MRVLYCSLITKSLQLPSLPRVESTLLVANVHALCFDCEGAKNGMIRRPQTKVTVSQVFQQLYKQVPTGAKQGRVIVAAMASGPEGRDVFIAE